MMCKGQRGRIIISIEMYVKYACTKSLMCKGQRGRIIISIEMYVKYACTKSLMCKGQRGHIIISIEMYVKYACTKSLMCKGQRGHIIISIEMYVKYACTKSLMHYDDVVNTAAVMHVVSELITVSPVQKCWPHRLEHGKGCSHIIGAIRHEILQFEQQRNPSQHCGIT